MRFTVALSLFIAVTLALLGCGGGGGGGSGNVAPVGGQTSRINGTVTDFIAAAPTAERSSILTKLEDFLSLTEEALAQDGDLGGILVSAFQDRVKVAMTATSPDGTFSLEVPAGEITLVLEKDGMMASFDITAPAGGVVTITLSLEPDGPDPIVIREMEILQGPIVCGEGSIELTGEGGVDLVIDGEGGDCIRAEGNCSVMLNVDNVTLNDCRMCINADDTADVTILADVNIVCNATEDGISTNDDSTVILGAGNYIKITSNQGSGISAGDMSQVNLDAPTCFIEGPEAATVVEDGAVVNTESCDEFVFNEGQGPSCFEQCNDLPNEELCIAECEQEGEPPSCAQLCDGMENEGACIEECEGVACEEFCEEVCVREEGVCVRQEEVCDEICVEVEEHCESQCIEWKVECDEFCIRDEDVCVEEGCIREEEVCEGEGEAQVCEVVCVEDGCIRFDSVCVEWKEECDEVCIEDETVCEVECIRHELECDEVCVEDDTVCVEHELQCEIECHEI